MNVPPLSPKSSINSCSQTYLLLSLPCTICFLCHTWLSLISGCTFLFLLHPLKVSCISNLICTFNVLTSSSCFVDHESNVKGEKKCNKHSAFLVYGKYIHIPVRFCETTSSTRNVSFTYVPVEILLILQGPFKVTTVSEVTIYSGRLELISCSLIF